MEKIDQHDPKITRNSNKVNFLNDLDQIKSHVKSFNDKIHSMHPHEKYRGPVPGRGIQYDNRDFLDLIVNEGKKKIKLRNVINYPDRSKHPKPSSIAFILPGMGGHSELGSHIAQHLKELGLVVASYDYRGFGQSEGDPGLIEDFEILVQDTRQFIQQTEDFVQQKFSTKIRQRFLIGQSMGGLLAYYLSHDNAQFTGVFYFAPAFEIWQNFFMRGLVKLTGTIFKRKSLPRPTKESLICKNPLFFEEPDAIAVKILLKLGTVKALFDRIAEFKKIYKGYKTPFVIIVAGVDKMVIPQSGVDFYVHAEATDKSIWYYPDCWHNIWQEDEIYHILERVKVWISERIDLKESKF